PTNRRQTLDSSSRQRGRSDRHGTASLISRKTRTATLLTPAPFHHAMAVVSPDRTESLPCGKAQSDIYLRRARAPERTAWYSVGANCSAILEETHESVVTPQVLFNLVGRNRGSGYHQSPGRDRRNWGGRERPRREIPLQSSG